MRRIQRSLANARASRAPTIAARMAPAMTISATGQSTVPVHDEEQGRDAVDEHDEEIALGIGALHVLLAGNRHGGDQQNADGRAEIAAINRADEFHARASATFLALWLPVRTRLTMQREKVNRIVATPSSHGTSRRTPYCRTQQQHRAQ